MQGEKGIGRRPVHAGGTDVRHRHRRDRQDHAGHQQKDADEEGQ